MSNLYERMKETVRSLSKSQAESVNGQSGEENYSNKIGKKEIQEANQILRKYKEGKKQLENKIIANEEWWKMRHWSRTDEEKDDSASGWLFNCIISKHADAMDAFPEPNILPREPGDEHTAEVLSEIIPVILAQNKMRNVYSDVMWYKLIQGTGVFGVFWDANKLNGLGDITVAKVDLLNLFWDMSQSDIQNSENLFLVRLMSNRVLEGMYPKLKGKMKRGTESITRYLYEDYMDTSDKSVVVDWYYKRSINGKTVLYYVKYVGDEVLYATQNTPQLAERGLYDHGKYPFVFDKLFPIAGLAVGFGYVDVCRRPQAYIDSLNAAIQKNALMASTPRYFSSMEGSVNENEFMDWTKPIVHTAGNLGEDSLRKIEVSTLDSIYVNILNNKIEELKETSGNRDVSNGGTVSGVTAASGIAAMQEQSGKTSRDSTESSYTAYEEIIALVVELIRQFYDTQRQFRIIGENGQREYVKFDNTGIQTQAYQGINGEEMYYKPVFDIEINAQKASPYSKLSQNEFALQLYNQGFFNPQMADQALACIKIMDFNHKEDVVNLIENNGTMYQQLLMMQEQMNKMAQIIDSMQGSSLSGKFHPDIEPGRVEAKGEPELEPEKEHAFVEKAREQAQQASQPR